MVLVNEACSVFILDYLTEMLHSQGDNYFRLDIEFLLYGHGPLHLDVFQTHTDVKQNITFCFFNINAYSIWPL